MTFMLGSSLLIVIASAVLTFIVLELWYITVKIIKEIKDRRKKIVLHCVKLINNTLGLPVLLSS